MSAGSNDPKWAIRDDSFPWRGDHIVQALSVCGLEFSRIQDFADIKPAERHRALALLYESFEHIRCSEEDMEFLLRRSVEVELVFRQNVPGYSEGEMPPVKGESSA
jgi:hypothetical protein